MISDKPYYRALLSSDWSECLSPNGPFDPIAFTYPELSSDLRKIFEDYTGNRISLATAGKRIETMLPQPFTSEQMDLYLDAEFQTYRGVGEFLAWCVDFNILVMINSTGMQGYFQRVFAKGLLPPVPLVAANPLIGLPDLDSLERYVYEVREIEDKAENTAAVVQTYGFSYENVAIMGDSGGDGAHFEWGAAHGVFLIGSMTKPSLNAYCRSRKIEINEFFGIHYAVGEPRRLEEEMTVDFTGLQKILTRVFHL